MRRFVIQPRHIGFAWMFALTCLLPDTSLSQHCVDYRDNVKWIGSGAVDGAVDAACMGETSIFITDTGSLVVVDLSHPNRFRVMGETTLQGTPTRIKLVKAVAYVATGHEGGFAIVDVADSANPRVVSEVNTPGAGNDVSVAGGYLYVADDELTAPAGTPSEPCLGSILVFDIADPTAPQLVSTVHVEGPAGRLAASEANVYVVGTELSIGDTQRITKLARGDSGELQYVDDYSTSNLVHSGGILSQYWGVRYTDVQVANNKVFLLRGYVYSWTNYHTDESGVEYQPELWIMSSDVANDLDRMSIVELDGPARELALDRDIVFSLTGDLQSYDHQVPGARPLMGKWLARWNARAMGVSDTRCVLIDDEGQYDVYDMRRREYSANSSRPAKQLHWSRTRIATNDQYLVELVPISNPWTICAGVRRYDLSDASSPVFIDQIFYSCGSRFGGIALVQDLLLFGYGNSLRFHSIETGEQITELPVFRIDSFVIKDDQYAILSPGDSSYPPDSAQLAVVDFVDASMPSVIAEVFVGEAVHELALDGKHLYMTSGLDRLSVFDVSDPSQVGTLYSEEIGVPCGSLDIVGDWFLTASSGRISVLKWHGDWVEVVDTHAAPGDMGELDSDGEMIYYASGQLGIQVYTLSKNGTLAHVGSDMSEYASTVHVANGYVYHSSGNPARLQCELEGTDAAPLPRPAGLRIHPNPFNPSTSISWVLDRPQRVRVSVYDACGRLIRRLHEGWLPGGEQRLTWDGRDQQGRLLPAAVYFARFEGESGTLIGKMALIK